MDIRAYNRHAWDRNVEMGNRWTVPVEPEVTAAAARGEWSLVLTPSKPVPRAWFPDDLRGTDLPAARETTSARQKEAVAQLDQAQATLRERLAADGPRGRLLLDAIEDADVRAAARESLAATDHVVAARVFVRREDEPLLRRALSIAFGDEVLVRGLGPATDAPALPRAVAGLPFAALRGLTSVSVSRIRR